MQENQTPRIFVADDKYADVIQELQRRGWRRFPHLAFPRYQLKYANYTKIQWRNVRPDQIVNHFQHSILFSQKDAFIDALYMYDCKREMTDGEWGGVDDFYPRAFDLSKPEQVQLFQCWFLYSEAVAILKNWQRISEREEEDLNVKYNLWHAVQLIRWITEDGKVVFCRHLVSKFHVDDPKWRSFFERSSSSPSQLDQEVKEGCFTLFDWKQVKREALDLIKALSAWDPQWNTVGWETNGLRSNNVWICKPSNLSQGRGITLISSLDQMFQFLHSVAPESNSNKETPAVVPQPKWIVQKYIEHPLVCQNGRKFDVRQWVLITSLEPLQVFWYRKCYLRFCSHPFSLVKQCLQDKFAHLSNYSIQKDALGHDDHDPNDSSSGLEFDFMWSSDRFQAELRLQTGRDLWTELIVPQMQNATRTAILSVHSKLRSVGRGFEWLGLDFLIDKSYHVWLLEVNVSPDVSHSTKVTTELVPDATKHALNSAFSVDDSNPRNMKLVSYLSTFQSCTEILEGPETESATNGWEPLLGFPTSVR